MKITATFSELTRKLATVGAASLLLASPAFAADETRQPVQAGSAQHQEQYQAGAERSEFDSNNSNAELTDTENMPSEMETTSSYESRSEQTSTSSEFSSERTTGSESEGMAGIEDREVSGAASYPITAVEDDSSELEQDDAGFADTGEGGGTAEIHMLESGETYSIDESDRTEDSLAGSELPEEERGESAAMDGEQSSFDENHGSLTGVENHGFEDGAASATADDEANQNPNSAVQSGESMPSDGASAPMLGASPGTEAMEAADGQPAAADDSFAESSDDSVIESLVDTQVVNSSGDELGSVEQVVVNRETGEAGLVVSIGGGEDGSRQIFAPIDEIALQGEELVWQTDRTGEDLADVEEYDSENFERVSGAQDTGEDAISAAEPTSVSSL